MFIKKPLFILIAMCTMMLAACDDSKNTVENAADTTKDTVEHAVDVTTEAVGDAADATVEAGEDAVDAVKEAAEQQILMMSRQKKARFTVLFSVQRPGDLVMSQRYII